jgi:predicted secreted hydrolase
MNYPNNRSLIENMQNPTKGLTPLVYPVKDLLYKKEYHVNSWFAIGHFETEGHKLNYLFHLMTLENMGPEPVIATIVSFTDETTGWYYGEDNIYPLSAVTVSESEFNLEVPGGFMRGNLEKMQIHVTAPDVELSVELKPVGYPIYNSGTGCFPLNGMTVYQYSIPTMETSGTLTIDGKTYNLSGPTWFDRQWEMMPGNDEGNIKWSWMDLNLDNGDVISLWGAVNNGVETAWATIMHPDGTQTVTYVEPLSKGESGYWLSEKSGQYYPTHWIVEIPEFDARLEVIPSPTHQEIVSVVPQLHKYEGASAVTGIYRKEQVSGYGYVELVGNWAK